MSTGTITPYRSAQRPGRDGFPQLVRSEWTKFRSVRGWAITMLATVLLTVLAIALLASTADGRQNPAASPVTSIGPGGEAVTDSFYFARQQLHGDGSITARVTSLTDTDHPGKGAPPISAPWAKAGIIVKASTKPGSAYAAVMATPGHGVRMQYDYTHDTAGLPGTVSPRSPRWLRLTRSGDTITGYDSTDGTHWLEIGTASLPGLPATVQAGLFAASPSVPEGSQGFASNDIGFLDTTATADFDHVGLTGTQPGSTWRAGPVGFATGPKPAPGTAVGCPRHLPRGTICNNGNPVGGDFARSGATFRVTGAGGDIAPFQAPIDVLGDALKGSLTGLIAVIALGALFITAEYRRGMIRTTFAASPRRGQVLAAKAVVIGAVTFVAGLIAAAVAVPIAEHKLASGHWASSVYPVWSLTSGHGLQMVLGTAGLLTAAAILALCAGAVLRRSAGAITAVVVLVILPLILGTILPQTFADWVLRLTPAAAFGLQQGIVQYPQVTKTCLPYNGCFPLSPWNGFAVLAVWVAIALGVAIYQLRRRDA
jgi:ABC-type transport system involved in multi-copper enzyme maturation permease subunit